MGGPIIAALLSFIAVLLLWIAGAVIWIALAINEMGKMVEKDTRHDA